MNFTQSALASSRLAVLLGSMYGRFSFQSNPPVIVSRWRIVMRRLRSSMLATLVVSKKLRIGVSRRREVAARDRDTDDHRGDRLGDRLQRVQLAASVGGMPPGVEVVVRAREVVRVERSGRLRVAVDAVVVVRVRAS